MSYEVGGVYGPSSRPVLPEGQPRPQIDGTPRQPGDRLPRIADGTVVNGLVLEAKGDETYLVRVAGRALLAQANLPLIPGQHFKAVWDASGEIPVLRLSEAETALLGKLAPGDREVASALLSRGLPLDDRALSALRSAWSAMGGTQDRLGPLAELWARGLALTEGNVQILGWYLNLNEKRGASLWKRVRDEIKARAAKGENPMKVLKDMKEGDDDGALFLKGHGMLSRPSREGVDPSLLAPALLYGGDEANPLTARITTGKWKGRGKSFWSVAFELEGHRLGPLSGEVESDGQSLAVTLGAERPETREALLRRRHRLRKELESLPLALQTIVIASARRERRTPLRGLDITV